MSITMGRNVAAQQRDWGVRLGCIVVWCMQSEHGSFGGLCKGINTRV